MKIFDNLANWQEFRRNLQTRPLGFVPTMGNLHRGHLSLIEKSKRENAATIVSIFVNPQQFNNPEDYKNYPQTLEADFALLSKAQVDYCLLPSISAVYPDNYRFQMTENAFTNHLEGVKRPGHFTGVLTVVLKLLNLVCPDSVYFGEKDYQQYCLIRDMVTALFMPIKVVACPTIREESGLAYSSRNNRLTKEQRQIAECFAGIFLKNQSIAELSHALQQAGIDIDYLEEWAGRRYVAIKLGDLRLIDNYAM